MRDTRHITLGIALGVFLGIITGCGSVDERGLNVDAADGAGGAAGGAVADATGVGGGGTAGAGLAGAGGSAGAPGRPLGAGCTTADQCGSGICDSATSTCCSGRADTCNMCIGGYLTPKTDGTACGGGLCDGVAPYVGERSCVAANFVCTAGTCTMTVVNCCTVNHCAMGQAACTGSAEDSSQPTRCIACQ